MEGKHNDLTLYYAKGLWLCYGSVIKLITIHVSQKNHWLVHTEPHLTCILSYLHVLHLNTKNKLLNMLLFLTNSAMFDKMTERFCG